MKSKRRAGRTGPLTVMYPDSAGIDVGSREHFVCVPGDRDERSVRSFGPCTADLHALAAWLKRCKIKQVAMEATGVYWIPLFEVLDRAGFEVLLVNGAQTANVKARKSDVLDCQWIQQLMSYGMLTASFRPADAFCAIRAMVRQRATLIRDAQREVQHMDKALVQMNVQLGRMLSDLSGKTGLSIIRAIVSGERDPKCLAELRDRRVRATEEEVAKSLLGNWRDEHLLALKQSLARFDLTQSQIDECDRHICAAAEVLRTSTEPPPDPRSKPRKNKRHSAQEQEQLRELTYQVMGVDLTAIPTIDVDTAMVIMSEVGADWSCFPTCEHFCSWVALAPGTRVSGGKRLSNAPNTAKNRVGEALKRCAVNARNSPTIIGASHRSRMARLPKACAVKATAHQLARLIYSMVTRGQAYVEQGMDVFEERQRDKQLRQLRRRAAQFGFEVVPKAA